MCSASDYKPPLTPGQLRCFGGTFPSLGANSAETLIFCHHLVYLLSASSLLHASETMSREAPVAPFCVNFPLAVTQLSESFYFPQRGSPDASVCNQWAVCYLALPGLAHVSAQKKCKQSCCSSALGWGEGLQVKKQRETDRKHCSFPWVAGTCRRMGFLCKSSGALGGSVLAMRGP